MRRSWLEISAEITYIELKELPNMANALQIDTLAFSKKLREAGADEKLADAIVEGVASVDTTVLTTKADLSETKAEILKWMFGALAGQTALLIAVIKLL
jgi:hypothetical protein